eukprot:Amastigsp_a175641_20.p2 type:complete len:260 gc:universal Amastigsp_a175641_20:1424-645(-)
MKPAMSKLSSRAANAAEMTICPADDCSSPSSFAISTTSPKTLRSSGTSMNSPYASPIPTPRVENSLSFTDSLCLRRSRIAVIAPRSAAASDAKYTLKSSPCVRTMRPPTSSNRLRRIARICAISIRKCTMPRASAMRVNPDMSEMSTTPFVRNILDIASAAIARSASLAISSRSRHNRANDDGAPRRRTASFVGLGISSQKNRACTRLTPETCAVNRSKNLAESPSLDVACFAMRSETSTWPRVPSSSASFAAQFTALP